MELKTVSVFEYRPCLVDGKKALFHMWFEDTIIALKFNMSITAEQQNKIWAEYAVNHVLPLGVESQTDKMLRGLVEMEDGTMRSVSPDKIRFLDTGNQMHEQGVCFEDGWIDHITGKSKGE